MAVAHSRQTGKDSQQPVYRCYADLQ